MPSPTDAPDPSPPDLEVDGSPAGPSTASDPSPRTAPGSAVSARGLATVLTVAVLIVLLAQVFLTPPAPWGGIDDNPGAWNPPRSRAELLVAKMDGHTFAQVASDPTMRHTVEDYGGDPENAAYRSARPLLGWVEWVASAGGRRALLAPAILALTAVWLGMLLLATDGLARALGANRVPLLALVALLPVSVAAIAYPGIADPLATSLALFALTAWFRDRRLLAVLLFCLAALTRETTILVALGLGLAELWRTRRLTGLWGLFLPPAVYLAWTAVVHGRIGAWPSDYSQIDGPFVGFGQGFPHWHPAEWTVALVLVASAVVLWRSGQAWMRAILLVHLGFFVFMNYQVWWVWLGFGRVGSILPVLAYVALVTRAPADEPVARATTSSVGSARP